MRNEPRNHVGKLALLVSFEVRALEHGVTVTTQISTVLSQILLLTTATSGSTWRIGGLSK